MTSAPEILNERRVFVSWRDPVGSIHPIGCLLMRVGAVGERYTFAYLKAAERLAGFQPLPGLPTCTNGMTTTGSFQFSPIE